MIFTPRPWQQPMIEHVLDVQRGQLWAGMGTGKTSASLYAIEAGRMLHDGPVLVIAPLRVAQNTWPNEVAKWDQFRSTLSVAPIVGSVRARELALRTDAAIHTINYENLPWLIERLDGRWPWSHVIADECTKLKSFRGMLARSSKGKEFVKVSKSHRAGALARVTHGTHLKQFHGLTGTPATNGLKDVWGPMWFIDAGKRLGNSYTAFTSRWFTKSFDGWGVTPVQGAQQHIENQCKDVCLTVDLADYMTIDKPLVTEVVVELPSKVRTLYRTLERKMFTELGTTTVTAVHAAALSVKCLQLCSGAVIDDEGTASEVHDAKIQALESIIEESGGEPVLIAYQFKSSAARIQKAFKQARLLDSSAQTERDWNAGKIAVLLAHPASAGHGLNLQDGGRTLVYFDQWWNLEERLQIAERIGPTRQMQSGHKRLVKHYVIIARDSADEVVIARNEGKATIQEALWSAMKRRQP